MIPALTVLHAINDIILFLSSPLKNFASCFAEYILNKSLRVNYVERLIKCEGYLTDKTGQ